MIKSKEKFIEGLPGEYGWWEDGAKETIERQYDFLRRSFSDIQVQNIIEEIYWSNMGTSFIRSNYFD